MYTTSFHHIKEQENATIIKIFTSTHTKNTTIHTCPIISRNQ